jgi:putative peptide zinc metalloprotease protein
VRGLFTRTGLAAWVGILALGALLAGSHWSELTDTSLGAILDPTNLLLLFVTYPLVKALPSSAAFAASLGRRVHELGLGAIVGMPVPYVDASASAVFADKRQLHDRRRGWRDGRVARLDARAVRVTRRSRASCATSRGTMLIEACPRCCSGNPLLRFDGYVLSDAIGY